MKVSPLFRVTLPSANLPMRIFGPCRSTSTPTVRPRARASERTSSARWIWSSAVPWEKFRRTTSTPASTMRSRISGALDAGPRVATILVLRSIIVMSFPAAAATGFGFACALLEDLHRGQFLALEELQEGAAGGRDVGHLVIDAILLDRGNGVAAAGQGEGLGRRDRLGDLDR